MYSDFRQYRRWNQVRPAIRRQPVQALVLPPSPYLPALLAGEYRQRISTGSSSMRSKSPLSIASRSAAPMPKGGPLAFESKKNTPNSSPPAAATVPCVSPSRSRRASALRTGRRARIWRRTARHRPRSRKSPRRGPGAQAVRVRAGGLDRCFAEVDRHDFEPGLGEQADFVAGAAARDQHPAHAQCVAQRSTRAPPALGRRPMG